MGHMLGSAALESCHTAVASNSAHLLHWPKPKLLLGPGAVCVAGHIQLLDKAVGGWTVLLLQALGQTEPGGLAKQSSSSDCHNSKLYRPSKSLVSNS